jgi:hypothetical protein
MIRGVPPPPFRSDSHVAHKSSFSIVGTHDSRRKFDLIVYFADYPQTDFLRNEEVEDNGVAARAADGVANQK